MGGGGGVRGVTDRDLESGRAGCAALADTRWRGPSSRGLGAPGRPFCEDARSAQENRILGGVWGCTELDPLATPPRSPPARQTVSQPCLCPAARDRPPQRSAAPPNPSALGAVQQRVPSRAVRPSASPSPFSCSSPSRSRLLPTPTRSRHGSRELTPCPFASAPFSAPLKPAPRAPSTHPLLRWSLRSLLL